LLSFVLFLWKRRQTGWGRSGKYDLKNSFLGRRGKFSSTSGGLPEKQERRFKLKFEIKQDSGGSFLVRRDRAGQ
jgi:hypothetical protein